MEIEGLKAIFVAVVRMAAALTELRWGFPAPASGSCASVVAAP